MSSEAPVDEDYTELEDIDSEEDFNYKRVSKLIDILVKHGVISTDEYEELND